MRQILTIPGTLPTVNEFNKANRSHWSKGYKFKKCYQEMVEELISLEHLKPMFGKVGVRYTFIEPNTKRDQDNVESFAKKVIHDALVCMQILKNDNPKNLEILGVKFRYNKQNPRIIVELEEL